MLFKLTLLFFLSLRPLTYNKVHFIFGLKEQTDAFPFAFFLNIISAAVQIAPDEIVMSYHNEPEGIWWKAVKVGVGASSTPDLKAPLVSTVQPNEREKLVST